MSLDSSPTYIEQTYAGLLNYIYEIWTLVPGGLTTAASAASTTCDALVLLDGLPSALCPYIPSSMNVYLSLSSNSTGESFDCFK